MDLFSTEKRADIVNSNGIQIRLPILIETKKLKPNPWNPNKVAKPEMDLLEVSIKKSGFCFPLVVIKVSEQEYMIVDGFHRHKIAIKLKMPVIPVVVLEEDIDELMNATIRFNRAKGTHQVNRMSNIVAELIYLGYDDKQISKNLGMDKDEVLRLKQNTGLLDVFKDCEYSKSWD